MKIGPGHSFRRHLLQIRGKDSTLRAGELRWFIWVYGVRGGNKGWDGQITVSHVIGENEENVGRRDFCTTAAAAASTVTTTATTTAAGGTGTAAGGSGTAGGPKEWGQGG